mmetsp:Transcript_30120/g.51465  ORF Transcript_30120/g.51465 Transcript_30120/m.51465 type:complete len:86 (-) Transcript_30120:2756-3013(-)
MPTTFAAPISVIFLLTKPSPHPTSRTVAPLMFSLNELNEGDHVTREWALQHKRIIQLYVYLPDEIVDYWPPGEIRKAPGFVSRPL